MWLCRHYEQYFVALDETRMHMEKLGIHPGKLTVSGIPIDPVFSASKDKREMRIKHGLAPDKTTILVSAGGFGVGRVEDLSTCLSELQHEAQVVVLCGRNEELKKRLDKRAAKRRPGSRRSIINIGYTTLMDEFMSASDILLGKPGRGWRNPAHPRGLRHHREHRRAALLSTDGRHWYRCRNCRLCSPRIEETRRRSGVLVLGPRDLRALETEAILCRSGGPGLPSNVRR